MSQFIRIFRNDGKAEVLYSVNHITKIEVLYGLPANDPDDTNLYAVTVRRGLEDPNAMRSYKVYFGSESIFLPAEPDDPVIRVIQEIYRNAIRADAIGPDSTPS